MLLYRRPWLSILSAVDGVESTHQSLPHVNCDSTRATKRTRHDYLPSRWRTKRSSVNNYGHCSLKDDRTTCHASNVHATVFAARRYSICISAAYAVTQCLFVCPSRSCILSKWINESSKKNLPLGSHTILCLPIPNVMAIFRREHP